MTTTRSIFFLLVSLATAAAQSSRPLQIVGSGTNLGAAESVFWSNANNQSAVVTFLGDDFVPAARILGSGTLTVNATGTIPASSAGFSAASAFATAAQGATADATAARLAGTGTATINGNVTVSGTNTGDQTITLTGAVTGTGTGSFATTFSGTQSANVNWTGTNNFSGMLQVSGTDTTAFGRSFLTRTDAPAANSILWETKSGNFTAVSGGRYAATATLTVTNPSGGSDGDFFQVLNTSGTATVNGTAFAPGRWPITIARVSGTWSTLANQLTENLTLQNNLTVNGNTTLGDASGDTFTITAGTVTAANATATGATNIANVSTLDSRYQPVATLYLASDVSADSTTFVDSSGSVTLTTGTYSYTGFIRALTSSTTSGITVGSSQSNGSSTGSGLQVWFASNNADAGSGSNTIDRISNGFVNTPFMFGNAPVRTVVGTFNGTITVSTGSSTYKFNVAQRSATDAANPALLKAGSWVSFQKLP